MNKTQWIGSGVIALMLANASAQTETITAPKPEPPGQTLQSSADFTTPPVESPNKTGRTRKSRTPDAVPNSTDVPSAPSMTPPPAIVSRFGLDNATVFSGGGGGVTSPNGSMEMWADKAVQNSYVPRSSSSSRAPSVIRFSNSDPAFVGEMEEDLGIMEHILSKTFDRIGGDAATRKLGVPMAVTSKSMQGSYIEGLGVVFSAHVGFPLAASKATEKPAQSDSAGMDWEKARREMHGERDNPDSFVSLGDSSPDFDAQRVAAMKSEVLNALRNARNIRGLAPSDYVCVMVTGPGSGLRRVLNNGNMRLEVYASGLAKSGGSGSATTWTLKVMKSDLDALAQDKISMEDLEKKAQSSSYFSKSDSGSSSSWSATVAR